MTEKELEKENAALRQQLAGAIARGDDAIGLVDEIADQRDAALGLLVPTVAAAVGQKPAAPPAPKPAAPPKPESPPPARPASMSAFYALPAAERARVREHFGAKLEDELDAEFHDGLRVRNARGGITPDDRRLTQQIAEDRTVHAPSFDAAQYAPPAVSAAAYRERMSADYEKAQKTLRELPHGSLLAAQNASLNASIGSGRAAPARPAAPAPAPAPRGAAPTGSKTRFLGGARK